MVLFNYATKEITLKVVYYGPGLCGKTTNLQYIHSRLNPKTRGKLISLATEADRTLFFDFLPMEMGTIKGFKIRFQLYTVPGQVRYNATRKLVLKGSDGVVFVADSQKSLMNQNIEGLNNLKENLLLNGIDPGEVPLVMQFNKRDLKDINTVSELNEKLNYRGVLYFESIAIKGDGVLETFKEMTKILLKKMSEKHSAEVKEEVSQEELSEELSKEVAAFQAEEVSKPVAEEMLSAVEVEAVNAEEIAEEISEEIYTGEYETPKEEKAEEISLMPVFRESIDKILNTLKEIKEGMDSLPGIISELKKSQETLIRRITENEETRRKKDEEILKSLNDLRLKVGSLGERPDKKWFRLR